MPDALWFRDGPLTLAPLVLARPLGPAPPLVMPLGMRREMHVLRLVGER